MTLQSKYDQERKEGFTEGRTTGFAEGKTEGCVLTLFRRVHLSAEEIAKELNITLEQVQAILAQNACISK